MLLSIALIMLFGLMAGTIFKRMRLPYIIGMLAAGIILGPYVLNLLDDSILNISADLRQIALIVILAKAGLTLDINDLKRVGRPAVLLCFLPATMEIIAYLLFAPGLMGISLLEAGIIGAVMGAVSPAIIVPSMSKLIDEGWGTKKGIPQMIVAGSSADDVYVVVVFTALISLAQGGKVSAAEFLQVPVSIVLGIVLGAAGGMVLVLFFQRFHMRDTVKVIILLCVSFLFVTLEEKLEGIVAVSGLLAVMSMGITIYNRYDILAKRITGKFSKIWVPAEILLFVLVGAVVNVKYALSAGIMMVLMLLIGLIFRLAGTYLCVVGTKLNRKERIFCMISQIPKATVQAAIGGVALARGLPCGNIVLTAAVVSILITAPAGALGIEVTYKKLLSKEK
ncbi:cation:proton antiporter [Ruminococcus gauvreauii]|uniref:Cation:proton antiporter n=1 Tax=Ruminococcus gauvreauii TaxID=438033 RepID=A0ABY5VHV2_9FIRM|nr:cation:proton antiporter [Ruminococcus gauvreauii]UWP60190.1 cation:proton antiporter [Ruminococcus gauvreauii]